MAKKFIEEVLGEPEMKKGKKMGRRAGLAINLSKLKKKKKGIKKVSPKVEWDSNL